MEEAPDVVAALRERGVLELPAAFLGRGAVSDVPNLRARRLVFEGVLRRAALAQRGVDVVAGDRVTQLVARPGRPPLVQGVMTGQGRTIIARVVADATGRRSPMAKWVAEHGVTELPATMQPIGLQYYTRFYRLRDSTEFPTMRVPIGARLSYLTALVAPCDNRTFSLTIACFVEDPYRRALADPGAFERVLLSLPPTRPWVQAGEAISPVHAMARIENRWQRLVETDGAPLVGGVVLVGDSSMHTNPTFARGTSLALAQAKQLATTLELNGDRVACTAEFDGWIAVNHGQWFNIQAGEDKNLVATFRATLRGEPELTAPDPSRQFFRAMVASADTDDVIAQALTQYYHLLVQPSEIFSDKVLNQKVMAYTASHEVKTTFETEGPTRAEFETIIRTA
jgi:2-polyprenyl-6-methoxyphenol hydroxylase-like FAD-dependent oxidoreductase